MGGLQKIKRIGQKNRLNKIIGYVAIRKGTPSMLCDDTACIIGGIKRDIERYITANAGQNPEDYIIKKTTFGEIVRGLKMGGVYALDQGAFDNYLPVAKACGMPLAEFKIENDNKPYDNAIRLIRIQWITPEHG